MLIEQPYVYAKGSIEEIFAAATNDVPQPHTELNGKCIRNMATGGVSFILEGRKCGIPNPETFNKIFDNWSQIIDVGPEAFAKIESDVPFENNACVFRGDNSSTWYLIHDNKKCPITSQEVVSFCSFNKNPLMVSQVLVNAIPGGAIIDYGK